MVHFNDVRFFRVGQISYSPLKAVLSVFPLELRVAVVESQQIVIWVEGLHLLADLIFPFLGLLCGKVLFSRPFPLPD